MAEGQPVKREFLRTFRLPLDEWKKFAEEAERAGSDRSKELVNFVRWYNRDPRGKPPKRPPLPATES